MSDMLILVFAVLLLVVVPMLLGADSRDGRDWQPRDGRR